MSNSALSIERSHSGVVCIVALKGRVDSTSANDVMVCLSNLISAGEKAILVDLGGLLYLTSAAFRVLLVATDEAERGAARLALCNVIGHVRELFEMGGLLDAFTIHGSREEGMAQLG
jgi:anti-anti-sigma factor